MFQNRRDEPYQVRPMGILLVFIAAALCSASNFCMRKSLDRGGTTQAFLSMQMSFAFLAGVLLGPVRTGQFALSVPMLVLGIFAGLVYSFMISSLGKALERGPPGLTFSALSGATVMPAIVMALAFGYSYTIWHAIGSVFVLAGLFWAGRGLRGMQSFRAWIFFVSSMFLLHVCLLVVFQWRALLLNSPHPEEIVSWFTAEQIQSQWFMSLMYGTAMICQTYVFLTKERRKLQGAEVTNGIFGGLTNGLCTFFLIWATEVASGLENAVIYPIFSVMIILFSNMWSQKIYQESVNWRACQVCALGLLVATVDWKTVLAAIGWF